MSVIFRRIYGNFVVTDNRAVSAADYTRFSVAAPADSRLPSSGATIGGLYDVSPAKFGLLDNYVTLASNYGTQIEHWNGVDINLINARLPNGLSVQGGLSSGKTLTDNCDVVAEVPEALLGATSLLVGNAGVCTTCRTRAPLRPTTRPLARVG